MRHHLLPRLRLVLALAAAMVSAATTLAQGSLTPPGAPGPTMIRLDQINGRIPLIDGLHGTSINADTHTITITQPGSYYLTGHVLILPGGPGHGVVIAADDVTLDLNGYSLRSTATAATGNAITFTAPRTGTGGIGFRQRIRIFNGTISGGATLGYNTTSNTYEIVPGGGFQSGVVPLYGEETTQIDSVVVENLMVNGMNESGIILGIRSQSIVRDCLVSICGNQGIQAGLVENTMVRTAGYGGISGTVVRGCEASTYLNSGIYGDTVSDSVGYAYSSGPGITAESASNSKGHCTGNAGTGLRAKIATNCVGLATGNVGTFGSDNTPYPPTGLSVTGTAQSCTGSAQHGVAIRAKIAVACVVGEDGGTTSIEHKYNMP